MQKITGVIIVLAIICLISGGFAFMISDSSIEEVNTNSIAKTNDIQNEVKEIASPDNSEKSIVSNDLVESIIKTETTDNEIHLSESPYHWIPIPNTFGGFTRDDLNYTDRYHICLNCDKAFPLGEITQLIPEAFRYCNGSHIGGNFEYKNTFTYEDIMEIGDYESYFGHGPDEDAEAYHLKVADELTKLEQEQNKNQNNVQNQPTEPQIPNIVWDPSFMVR